MDRVIITIDEEFAGDRIDKVIAENLENISRTAVQRLIDGGFVVVSGKSIKASYKTVYGDTVTITLPPAEEPDIRPENIPLDVLYEDDDVIVVNKPKDMVVHPAAGHYTGTLVNALMYHCKGSLSGINGVLRPGIVHRIDKDTTGALVVCKNDAAHAFISEQLKVHSITRKYVAITKGALKDEEGRIEAPIGRDPKDRLKMAVVPNGKEAVTNYRVLDHLDGKHDYIECRLETGRTHQIRVHMAYISHPLLGDDTYGGAEKAFKLQGQCLHARDLGFIHPTTRQYMEFSAPLPDYFEKLLKTLKNK